MSSPKIEVTNETVFSELERFTRMLALQKSIGELAAAHELMQKLLSHESQAGNILVAPEGHEFVVPNFGNKLLMGTYVNGEHNSHGMTGLDNQREEVVGFDFTFKAGLLEQYGEGAVIAVAHDGVTACMLPGDQTTPPEFILRLVQLRQIQPNAL